MSECFDDFFILSFSGVSAIRFENDNAHTPEKNYKCKNILYLCIYSVS